MRKILFIISLFACTLAGAQSPQQLFWQLNQMPAGIAPCAGIAYASDADAQKFLCAAKITDATIASAVNQLVISLKDSSLWSTIVAAYPVVSDNILSTRSEQTAYNLKDTGTFKISWNAGASFAATGVDFTSTGQGSTGITPSTHLSSSSVTLGYYSREQTTGGRDWQAINGSSTQLAASCEVSSGTAAAYMYNGSTAVSGSNSGSQGMFIFTRTAASGVGNTKIYKNGTQIVSGGFTAASVPNTPLSLGYQSGSGQRECAFAFVSGGLTADQARAMSTIVNNFNSTLSRNIY